VIRTPGECRFEGVGPGIHRFMGPETVPLMPRTEKPCEQGKRANQKSCPLPREAGKRRRALI
jgi:hypothetical protein